MKATSADPTGVQYAALPWRKAAGRVEILLITTLTTKTWIVPKGWPVVDLPPHECAAHEALEEAGVLGGVATKPLGSFHYTKRRKSGESVPCEVVVFPLEVLQQRRNWAEKGKREMCWCSVEEALARVAEPSLRRLLVQFGKAQRSVAGRRPSARAPSQRLRRVAGR